MRRALPAAAAAWLAACGGSGPAMDRLDADPLHRRAKDLQLAESCARAVPIEYGRSYPVPAKGPDGYKVLFYPSRRTEAGPNVLTPELEGRFPAAGTPAGSCRSLPAGPAAELGPPIPPGLKGRRYYEAQLALYESLAQAGDAYHKGSGDPARLKAFLEAFRAAAEPGLLPHYYRLNPDFWEWLRKQAGDSIPPA